MRSHARVLIVLALTQITGWGMISVLPVAARLIAADFKIALPEVFLGTSLMYGAMGLASPLAGRAFRRFGPRDAMAAGSALIGLGLAALAFSPNLITFWAAWALIGIAGALFLTTAAYAYIAAWTDTHARSLIGTLMLVTGLYGSVFWPMTAWMSAHLGWRDTVLVYAAVMACGIAPLVRLGLPDVLTEAASTPHGGAKRGGSILALLIAAIALNSFVTFGIEAVGIQLLQSMGLDLSRAVAIASFLGVAKVSGRIVDLVGGKRWDGLSTAIASGAMVPAGLFILWSGGAGIVSVVGYLAIYGIGSGAFAVARATMPLVFFDKADYAAAMATVALPMNLINALAAPVLAALMAAIGPQAVFATLGAFSLTAFVLLLRLNSLRAAALPAT